MLNLYFESNTRYYRLTLEKDLLDYWVVVCTYGGKQNNLGQIKKYAYQNLCDALKKVSSVTCIRLKRGYIKKDKT